MTRTLASGSWCDPGTFPASASPASRRAHRHARARLRRRLLSELAELDHFSHAASFWPSGSTSVCGTSRRIHHSLLGFCYTLSVERGRGHRAGTFPNHPQAPATSVQDRLQHGFPVSAWDWKRGRNYAKINPRIVCVNQTIPTRAASSGYSRERCYSSCPTGSCKSYLLSARCCQGGATSPPRSRANSSISRLR